MYFNSCDQSISAFISRQRCSVQVESGSTLSRSYILTQPVKLLLKAKLLYSDWGGKSSYRFPLFEDSL